MNILQRALAWLTSSQDPRPSTPTPSSADAPSLHATLISALLPQQPPAARQEQFADQQEQSTHQRDLYRRIVATNNRNVTRDYGIYTEEVISTGGKYDGERDADDSDYKDLERYGSKVADLAHRRAQERTFMAKPSAAPYRAPVALELGKFGKGRFE